MFQKIRRIHFVGIGGIGMSGIAELLLNLGYKVSGSDTRPSPITQRLAELGGTIHAGHAAGHVEGADVVVVASAVRPDNPEIGEAKRRQLLESLFEEITVSSRTIVTYRLVHAAAG